MVLLEFCIEDDNYNDDGEGFTQYDEDNKDGENLKRALTEEQEQPLDQSLKEDGEISNIMVVKSENGDKKGAKDDKRILKDSERGSKETTNGVLETPPPEESDDGADKAATQLVKADPKPRVYYSDKSESSVESMMADTPSNYNIPNGRYDDKSKILKMKRMNYDSNLEIITEIEGPSKAPSQLASIKHLKTTKNERQFIDSVIGSDKNSYLGDIPGGYGRGNESDRGPMTEKGYPGIKTYDIRRHSKSNIRNNNPARSLEQNYQFQKPLQNQFMISNNGSENTSQFDGLDNHSKPNFKPVTENNDEEMSSALKSGLPPIRYPKYKKKSKKKKTFKIIEDKNLSITNINDLEAAYLSGNPNKDMKKSFYGTKNGKLG